MSHETGIKLQKNELYNKMYITYRHTKNLYINIYIYTSYPTDRRTLKLNGSSWL